LIGFDLLLTSISFLYLLLFGQANNTSETNDRTFAS